MVDDRLVASLISLAEEHPAHLLAYVRAHNAIFLNPSCVGDVTWPLADQLAHCLRIGRCPDVDALEHTLLTGGADEASSSEEDEGVYLSEDWRADPFEAWASCLKAEAMGAAGTCVLTPDGRCVGPLPVAAWLQDHLPAALNVLCRAKSTAQQLDEPYPSPHVAISQAQQLADKLAASTNVELKSSAPDVSKVTTLLSQLILVLHCIGELPDAWMVAEARNDDLGTAYTAARFLAEALLDCRSIVEAETGAVSARRDLLAELQCVGFVAARLVEQEHQAVRLQTRHDEQLGLTCDASEWCGDDEGPEQHAAALLELTLSLAGGATGDP
mmetsp:Transcript_15523/g.40104  ORF Transcript_15523/g.40104 Transcript_15523/m.40104 type:complete len:328 (+) Transcript_15523:72-1055(+)